LDFGEGPEEEEPQGPKLVNKRLSSGCARFVGVTCQTKKKKTTKNIRQRHGIRQKQKGKKDTHCRLHPHLLRGTTVNLWEHDV